MTRLYLNVGSMDEVRPGDLIGAITNEAGISRAELGKVDVRERHSTVEVSTAVANNVVSKLTGIQMKGRRLLPRIDEDRPRERPRGGPPRDRDRGSRPPRGAGPRGSGSRGPGSGNRPHDRSPRPPRDRPPRKDA